MVLPLQCETKAVDGQTERVCTADGDVTLAGKLGTVVTLPAYSIEDPVPSRDGCTLSSIFNPRWLISSFWVIDNAVSFEIILQTDSRGFQYPMPIYQGEAVAGSPGWYQCQVGADGGNGLPLWPYACTFKYTAATKEFVLKADWACQDLDAKSPYVGPSTHPDMFICEQY